MTTQPDRATLTDPRHNQQTSVAIVEIITWEDYAVPLTDPTGTPLPGTIDTTVVRVAAEARYNGKTATFQLTGSRDIPETTIALFRTKLVEEILFTLFNPDIHRKR